MGNPFPSTRNWLFIFLRSKRVNILSEFLTEIRLPLINAAIGNLMLYSA
jgi:hypothetical protein